MSATPESAVPSSLPTLKARTLSAGLWVGVGALSGNALRLVSNLILARLLFPEAFGLMMIATTVSVILVMLSDVGIQQSIVRGKHGDDPVFLDTAWSIQILRGLLLWLCACALAGALHGAVVFSWVPPESTYADPQLPWIIVVSSLTAVILGFQSTDLATASRRLLMRPVVLMELSTQLLSIVFMCVLAWWLRSVWALVASGLLSAAVHTAASHFAVRIHRNRLRWNAHAVRELLSFGKWVALSSAVSVFVLNGDRLILGALVSAPVLGLFSIAASLATVLDWALATVFGRVVLPALSEVVRHRPEQLASTFYRLRWKLDPLALAVGGAMFAMGPLIVRVLYDARYEAAGEMLQILSLGLLFSRFSLVQQVYLALNEPRYLVALNAVRAVSLYLLVPAGYHYFGLNGALLAIASRELVVLPLIFWFNARHALNNFRLELIWLLFWPLGWSVGALILQLRSSFLAIA